MKYMELFKAHNQWKSRPADERFQSLDDMHMACAHYRENAAVAKVKFAHLRVEAKDQDLVLQGREGVQAKLTHWAMSQLSTRAGAPASYLRELPATLAAQNLNHGLKARGELDAESESHLLFHSNGSLVLRAALSDKYTRIWNSDVTARLMEFKQNNPQWKNPDAYEVKAPAKDGGWPEMTGKMVPSGLYASDHDMFAFLVDESKTLKGSPSGLNRGFFVWNSEVGASSYGAMAFLYDRVCGNNIVWGASNVVEMKIRHTGSADRKAFAQLECDLKKYADSSANEIESKIESAKRFQLGSNKMEALDKLLEMASKGKLVELNKNRISDALETAERREERYGNPLSLWGAVSGLTENSQNEVYADKRVKIDREAGKLLKVISF